MPSTGKEKSGATSPDITLVPPKPSGEGGRPGVDRPQDKPGFKPNRNSVVLHPNRKPMTKAELMADLKKAVENTK